MTHTNPFFDENKINKKLTSEDITPSELKRYLIIVFGTYKEAARSAGISENRLHQLFIGYKVPKTPSILKRIARGWNVDIVVLTKLFSELENHATPVEPPKKTSEESPDDKGDLNNQEAEKEFDQIMKCIGGNLE